MLYFTGVKEEGKQEKPKTKSKKRKLDMCDSQAASDTCRRRSKRRKESLDRVAAEEENKPHNSSTSRKTSDDDCKIIDEPTSNKTTEEVSQEKGAFFFSNPGFNHKCSLFMFNIKYSITLICMTTPIAAFSINPGGGGHACQRILTVHPMGSNMTVFETVNTL